MYICPYPLARSLWPSPSSPVLLAQALWPKPTGPGPQGQAQGPGPCPGPLGQSIDLYGFSCTFESYLSSLILD